MKLDNLMNLMNNERESSKNNVNGGVITSTLSEFEQSLIQFLNPTEVRKMVQRGTDVYNFLNSMVTDSRMLAEGRTYDPEILNEVAMGVNQRREILSEIEKDYRPVEPVVISGMSR